MSLMLNGTYLVDDPGPDTREGGEFRRANPHFGTDPPDGPFTGYRAVSRLCSLELPLGTPGRAGPGNPELENKISVSVAKPRRTDQGWVFDSSGKYADPELFALSLHQVIPARPLHIRAASPFLSLRIARPTTLLAMKVPTSFACWGPLAGRIFTQTLCAKKSTWNARIYPA